MLTYVYGIQNSNSFKLVKCAIKKLILYSALLIMMDYTIIT